MTDTDRIASRALADEVKRKVRERGLVLWLDADHHYDGLADELARGEHDFPYPVVALRGSYLELMLALEPYGNGLHPEHVLIHLPGLNKDTVQETPAYELYKAGTLFEKSLATVVREAAVGVAKLDEVDAFLREPGVSLRRADEWLASLRAEPRDRLTLLLESLGTDDVVLGVLMEDPRFREHLPAGGEKVVAFLEKSLGITPAWRTYRIGDAELGGPALATLVAGWLMAVEFVHDLREAPVMPELKALANLGPVAKDCRRLAACFREKHPDAYELFENELHEALAAERTSHHAAALGSIDTFRFEEVATRRAAIDALCQSEWPSAHELAAVRTPGHSFWVKRSAALQRTWEVIRLAADTGLALAETAHALDRCASLEEAVGRYVDRLAAVDRMHRAFEQRAHALLAPDLEDYDRLLETRTCVRRAYRQWANATNRAFSNLCATYGALPDRSLRQRALYEQVVQPLIERVGVEGRVALILVDALRFEMGQALAQELERDKYRVDVRARLAELPTETVIGMNALAPVEKNGRLELVMKGGSPAGFRAGEFTVSDPAGRVRAISDRSLNERAEDIELDEFQDLTVTQLRRRLASKPQLLVVRSRELDTAGEHKLHLGTFDQTLALLKSAISLLHHAGVEHFVVTSDHGFLMQDPTADVIPFGISKRVPQRRYALLEHPSGMPDVLEVKLSTLDYDVTQDWYVVFRPDTSLFLTTDKIAPFVHGGNSLQERVIPVLTIERHVRRGKTTSKYEVVAKPEPAHLGRQRLRVAVRLQTLATGSLDFAAPKQISLALRVPGRADVAIRVLDASPPATLSDGRVLVPPNRGEGVVEFELEGDVDEKVRVEVFHPDAIEDVKPKLVEGFFDVGRNRRLGKASEPPPQPAATPRPAGRPQPGWAELIEDPGYRRVLEIIAERRSINESELQQVLGSPRRVRMFARHFDDLVRLLPFEIEVRTVHGMKAYARKD